MLIVVTLAVGRTLRPTIRPGVALGVVAIGWSLFTTGRLDGFDFYWPEFAGRWTNTHESSLREVAAATTSHSEELRLAIGPNDWPEFRGRHRNSRALGVIDTDWKSNPPQRSFQQCTIDQTPLHEIRSRQPKLFVCSNGCSLIVLLYSPPSIDGTTDADLSHPALASDNQESSYLHVEEYR